MGEGASVSEAMSGEGFTLGEVLGQGGSGTVYAALKGGRELAVKVLREDVAPSPRECRRFVGEAERMKRVTHAGLVALVESGVLPDGRPYIVMPRLHGETLAHRLARGPLPLDRALAMFDVLAGAVAALHDAGLVHRDIKPENILLEVGDRAGVRGGDEDGVRPVLLDLGIAQEQDGGSSTTTLEGRVRGTPAYMAPERFFGASATTRSDVYELGVTLYAMVVGRLPWREAQSSDRLNPLDPAEHGVAVTDGLRRAIFAALATSAEARPPSVRAFATTVSHAASANGFAFRTTAPVIATVPPPPRAHVGVRLLAASVALAAALGVALTAAALRGHGQVPEPARAASTAPSASSAPLPSAFAVVVPDAGAAAEPLPVERVVPASAPLPPTPVPRARSAQPARPKVDPYDHM